MFDRLVVSTVQRRRGRTTKFFLGTVVIYLSAVASAFALSIVLTSPKLASELKPIFIGTLPPQAPQRTSAAVDHQNSGGAARQDLSNLRRFEDLIEHPQMGAPKSIAPGPIRIEGGDGPSGGDPNALPGPIR